MSAHTSPNSLNDGVRSLFVRESTDVHQVVDKETTHVLCGYVESLDKSHVAEKRGLCVGGRRKIGGKLNYAPVHAYAFSQDDALP